MCVKRFLSLSHDSRWTHAINCCSSLGCSSLGCSSLGCSSLGCSSSFLSNLCFPSYFFLLLLSITGDASKQLDRIKTAVSGSDGSNVRGNSEFVLQCVKSGVGKAEERVSRLQEILSDMSLNGNVGEDGNSTLFFL